MRSISKKILKSRKCKERFYSSGSSSRKLNAARESLKAFGNEQIGNDWTGNFFLSRLVVDFPEKEDHFFSQCLFWHFQGFSDWPDLENTIRDALVHPKYVLVVRRHSRYPISEAMEFLQ
jgi:hypothetical protein